MHAEPAFVKKEDAHLRHTMHAYTIRILGDTKRSDDDEEALTLAVVFCDGPVFTKIPRNVKQHMEVIAEFYMPGSPLHGKPAIVAVKSGNGIAILSTVHLESVFFRCQDFVMKYVKKILEKGNQQDHQELLDEMNADHDDTCSLESVTAVDGCGYCTAENIAGSKALVVKIAKTALAHIHNQGNSDGE